MTKLKDIPNLMTKNPYPESIFIPPTKKEYAKQRKALESVGLTVDKFSGDMGRHIWNYIANKEICLCEECEGRLTGVEHKRVRKDVERDK